MVQLNEDPSLLQYIDSQILAHLPSPLQSKISPETRPFVTLAWAQTLNGALCDHEGKPMEISCPASKAMTHVLRSRHDAILVGIGTILADDPRLTVRLSTSLEKDSQPYPVILDTHLSIPLRANIWNHPKRPLIFTSCTDKEKLHNARVLQADVVCTPNIRDLSSILSRLYRYNIRSLMVEGGYKVLHSFLQAQLFDTCIVTVAPMQVASKRRLEIEFPKQINTHWYPLDRDAIMVLENTKEEQKQNEI